MEFPKSARGTRKKIEEALKLVQKNVGLRPDTVALLEAVLKEEPPKEVANAWQVLAERARTALRLSAEQFTRKVLKASSGEQLHPVEGTEKFVLGQWNDGGYKTPRDGWSYESVLTYLARRTILEETYELPDGRCVRLHHERWGSAHEVGRHFVRETELTVDWIGRSLLLERFGRLRSRAKLGWVELRVGCDPEFSAESYGEYILVPGPIDEVEEGSGILRDGEGKLWQQTRQGEYFSPISEEEAQRLLAETRKRARQIFRHGGWVSVRAFVTQTKIYPALSMLRGFPSIVVDERAMEAGHDPVVTAFTGKGFLLLRKIMNVVTPQGQNSGVSIERRKPVFPAPGDFPEGSLERFLAEHRIAVVRRDIQAPNLKARHLVVLCPENENGQILKAFTAEPFKFLETLTRVFESLKGQVNRFENAVDLARWVRQLYNERRFALKKGKEMPLGEPEIQLLEFFGHPPESADEDEE